MKCVLVWMHFVFLFLYMSRLFFVACLVAVASVYSISYGQNYRSVNRITAGDKITFVSVPDEYVEVYDGDDIPDVFDVKAVTFCKPVSVSGIGLALGNTIKVGSYAQFNQALNDAVDGDIIELEADITIKPDASFPNTLGVWHPLVISKALIISGGSLMYSLRLERGLPLALDADVVLKDINLNMIPEGTKRTVIYVSDTSLVFDNVSTKADGNVAGVDDPRPTLVAGTWNGQPSAGSGAHITVKNAAYETIFEDIFTGNHNTAKSTPTDIHIESEEVRVKGVILSQSMEDEKLMVGTTTITTSSKRINRFEGAADGGVTNIGFINADVIPEVTMTNIEHVLLDDVSKVKLSPSSAGVKSVTVKSGSMLTFSANESASIALETLEGAGTVVIPQNCHFTVDDVVNQPTIQVREWLMTPASILDFVHYDGEQPGDIIYLINGEQYIRKNGLLVKYDSTVTPDADLYDAYIEYLGEAKEDYDDEYVLTRTWRAYDDCGNEEFFEQMIVVVYDEVSTGVDRFENAVVSLYPNPVKDVFSISGVNVTRVQVYNMLGVCVKTMDATGSYDISDLPDGVYFVVAESKGINNRFKITKRR